MFDSNRPTVATRILGEEGSVDEGSASMSGAVVMQQLDDASLRITNDQRGASHVRSSLINSTARP
jgi:hypothetical protein